MQIDVLTILAPASTTPGPAADVSSLIALLYFTIAGLITLAIETLRRYVKHRMDIWEAKNPVPDDDDDNDDDNEGEEKEEVRDG